MLGSVSGLDLPITDFEISTVSYIFITHIIQPIFILSCMCYLSLTRFSYNGRERGFIVVAPIHQRNWKGEIPPSRTILAPSTYELNPPARIQPLLPLLLALQTVRVLLFA